MSEHNLQGIFLSLSSSKYFDLGLQVVSLLVGSLGLFIDMKELLYEGGQYLQVQFWVFVIANYNIHVSLW